MNLPPKQIGKLQSQVLTLGLPDEKGECVLISPDREVPLGGNLY
jgi:tRNA-binding protein